MLIGLSEKNNKEQNGKNRFQNLMVD